MAVFRVNTEVFVEVKGKKMLGVVQGRYEDGTYFIVLTGVRNPKNGGLTGVVAREEQIEAVGEQPQRRHQKRRK